ncbi:Phage integrase [Pseudoalteromonas luteoviolacea B = ATCC 29581]|nr:Phage integrase [Pseudoalteromonas luteoviolacea B = ATCC 29581]
MARSVIRLTDLKIKNASIREKEYTLSDGDGLQLRIRPNGTKAWQFKYSDPITKKAKKISLGVYPELALQSARAKVTEYRALVADGVCPQSEIREKQRVEILRLSNTFLHMAETWFERKKREVTEEHARREWRSLEKYIFPFMANKPIDLITAPETITLLRPLEKAGKLSTIKRLCQTLNQILDYAVNGGYLKANPLAKIIKVFAKNKVQHMPTIAPTELPDFLEALNNAQKIQNKTKLLILWQLHTMTRPKEAARTRWADIDLEHRVWRIPASEMKRRREHHVPLTESAIAILEQMKALSGSLQYVFPGDRNPKEHMSLFTANAAIKRSLSFKSKLVAHGLRAIASTTLHEHGFDSLLIEACLAHSDTNVTRASYNRSDYFEQRKPIMSWWSDQIERHSPGALVLVNN